MSSLGATSKTAERRRALALALLPGLIVATTYVLWPRTMRLRAFDTLETRIAEAAQARPSPEIDRQQRERLLALQSEVAGARASAEGELSPAEDARDARDARATAADPVARAEIGRRMAELLAAHGLVLLEEKQGTEGAGTLPLDFAARLGLDARAPGRASQVRTVRYDGDYFDVLSALRGMVADGVRAVPLRLEMERPREGSTVPRWTLVWS